MGVVEPGRIGIALSLNRSFFRRHGGAGWCERKKV